MSDGLKYPREWEAIDRIKVVDPDGWSHGTYRSWGEQISREEWEQRISTSTLDFSQRLNVELAEEVRREIAETVAIFAAAQEAEDRRKR